MNPGALKSLQLELIESACLLAQGEMELNCDMSMEEQGHRMQSLWTQEKGRQNIHMAPEIRYKYKVIVAADEYCV